MKNPGLWPGLIDFGAASHPKRLTDLYPASFAPVAAAFAFMLTPPVPVAFVLFPPPIVGIDDEPMLRANPGVFPHVPAIAFPIANDLR
jgi:hypothetical protein